MDTPHWLQPALGYLELRMFEEAWAALDELPETRRNSRETLGVRISCRLDERRLEDALELCAEMRRRFPDEHAGYIQGAFCLHEMERTTEAQDWLQSGPPSLQAEATYFYNLGCYDLALGNEESACAWLSRAFEMEPAYYDDALKDPDFAPMIERIRTMKDDDDVPG